MKVKLSPKGEKWRCSEDDITRHSLIHALIELTDYLVVDALDDDEVRARLAAPETAGMQDDGLRTAIFGEDGENLFGGSDPMALRAWQFDPSDDDDEATRAQAILGGFPPGEVFFLILSTGGFEASTHLMYTRDEESGSIGLVGAYVPFFKGDPIKALHWVREIGMDLLDEPDPAEPLVAERVAD